MGWGRGTLGNGKDVGYEVLAKCEQRGCKERIDRGLAFACGDMHGSDDISCDGYFCAKHLRYSVRWDTGASVSLCAACAASNDASAAEEARRLGMSIDDYWEMVEAKERPRDQLANG